MKFLSLNPPPFTYQTSTVDPNDIKVSQWLTSWNGEEEIDAALIGIPLSRSSISASAASESPLAVRQSFRSFSTFDIDHEVDLAPLRVRDMGDIRMHTTDILQCHKNIEQGMGEVYKATSSFSSFIPLILGGDHSITCPSVKAFSNYHQGKKVGLLQFDTHFDVRSLENGGPSNGTPIRGLLTSGVLQGENIFQIGLHSFANSKPYYDYVKEQGIHYYTMRQVRVEGLETVLQEAIQQLNKQVDVIYVTVDIDVLDQASLPGSPGSSPGGMVSWDLFEAVHQLGMQEKVQAIDFVCLDPFRDVGMVSVRTMTHTVLSFLSGYQRRLR
jgi:formiminoglutamase